MGATSTLNGRPVKYDYEAQVWRDTETGGTVKVSRWHLTCPDCGTVMVKAWMEDEEHNWRCAWLCDCEPPTDGTLEVPE